MCSFTQHDVRQHDGFYLEEELTISENQGLIELQHVPVHNREGRSTNHARDQLAKYFTSPPGALPWQINKI